MREFDPAAGTSTPGADTALADAGARDPVCLNCVAPLAAAARFCGQCGQETRVRAPTVGEFLRQLVDHYLDIDGALWRTLRPLLLRPGFLTREYLSGRRRRYVLPLRLYLTVSVLVLLGTGAMLNLRLSDLRPLAMDLSRSHFVFVDVGALSVGIEYGRFHCRGVPERLCKRLEQRVMEDPSAVWQRATGASERAVGKLGTAMFFLVPVFALLMRAAFAGAPWRYAEHLVFALHLHAFWLLAVGVMALGVPGLKEAAALLVPVYGVLAARRVYGGPAWLLAVRLAVVAAAYVVLLGATLTGLMLWALLQ